MRGVRRSLLPSALLAVAALLAACAPAPSPAPPPPPSTTKPPVYGAACAHSLLASIPGAVASSEIDEASGIAASRRTDGVWWVDNDSGDSARLFAVGDDGRDLGEFDLAGASAVDWEAVAVGPGPQPGVSYLYAGDIGDNGGTRTAIQVYRVPEPAVAGAPGVHTLTGVETLALVYPDGPHDAEALFVDPRFGSLFVVTKDLVGGVGHVFSAPAGLAAGSTTTLTPVATVSLGPGQGVTGADITPRGDVIALRTYLGVHLYERGDGASVAAALSATPCDGAAPPFGGGTSASEPQGEAIGFTRDGRGYVTVSEGAHQSLHRFAAP
jgi:hypothetical protein